MDDGFLFPHVHRKAFLLQLLHALAADVGHVDLAAAQKRDARRLLWHELERHVLVFRHPDAPVVVDRRHLDVRAYHLLDELVGAGTDRLAGEHVITVHLDIFLREHDAFGRQRPREIRRDDQRRVFGDDHHAVGRRRLDVLDERAQRPGVAGRRALAHRALETELHVVRRHLVAGMELHALPQVERPALVVGRVLPLRGEPTRLRRLAVGRRADEIIEHERQVVLHVVTLERRVHGLGREARQGDGQLRLGLRPPDHGRPGNADGQAEERQDDDPARSRHEGPST